MASGGPLTRLSRIGAVALVAVSCGAFAWRCLGDPAIPFVVQDGAAPWIMFPQKPNGLMGIADRDALPVTRFERRFEADAAAAEPVLTLRALRTWGVWLNGERLAEAGPDDGPWRRFRRVSLAGRLVPGANTLRVDVTNATGPALLAARVDGIAAPFATDPSWRAAVAGGAFEPAIRVGTTRVNPSTFTMPSPWEGFAARRVTLAALLLLGVVLLAAWRSPGVRGAAAARPWLLPAAIVAAWTGVLSASLAIPLHVGFDAHHHVDYVRFLREHRALPLATDGWSMFHPPLYYALTALLVEAQAALAPDVAPLLAWKLPGVLAGLVTALAGWALARRLFGAASSETLCAGVFAGVLPMNVYIACYVTNESAHAAASSVLIVATAALLLRERPRPRDVALWALLAGAALLTKYTAWITLLVAGFFLLVRGWRVEGAAPGLLLRRVAWAAGIVFAVAGWFHLRHWATVGTPFPLNVDLPGQTRQWWSQPGYHTPAFFVPTAAFLAHPFLAGYHVAFDSWYATIWGDGQLAGQVFAQLRHPYWDYELMAAVYALALPATALLATGGLCAVRRVFRDPDPGRRAVFAFLLTQTYALLGSVLFMTLRQPDYGQVKAFYALAAAVPFSVFFGLGAGAARDRLARLHASAPLALWLWLVVFAGAALLSYVG